LTETSLIPGAEAELAETRFEDWRSRLASRS
jgi:hypothetical protein